GVEPLNMSESFQRHSIVLDGFQTPDAPDHRCAGRDVEISTEGGSVGDRPESVYVYPIGDDAEPSHVMHNVTSQHVRKVFGDGNDKIGGPAREAVDQTMRHEISYSAAVFRVDYDRDTSPPRRATGSEPNARVRVHNVRGDSPK